MKNQGGSFLSKTDASKAYYQLSYITLVGLRSGEI